MKTRIAIAVVIGFGICAAAIGLQRKGANAPSPAGPSTVGVKSTSSLVVAPGRVEPLSEEIRIGVEISGKIREIRVQEGDRVRRGQVLVVMENGDYAARVALAQANLAHKEADQLRVHNGSRTEERSAAEAAVAEAKAVLGETRAEWKRLESLFRSGDIARSSLDKAEREMSVAQARYEASCQRRELVEQSSRQEDILAAKADVEQARAQLAEAQATLAKTFIKSPIDGVVLRKKSKIGESISTDNPEGWIISLGDDRKLRVRVDVDEVDVARVEVGQTAYVTAEAYGDKRFTGKVVRVGQILGRKNVRRDEPTERVDTKILETLVELDPGQKLPSGLRVDAFIHLNSNRAARSSD